MKIHVVHTLLLFLALAGGITAHASVTLQVGDKITFLGQASGASAGEGGAFNWKITSVVPAPPASSPIDTQFQSFCDQIQQSIHGGDTYTVSDIINSLQIGTVINSSGDSLANLKGIYLFDEWSNGTSGGSIAHNSSNAAAVQVAIWESEGYNLSANNYSLFSSLGYGGSAAYNADEATISTLLGNTLANGTTYSSSWTPTDVSAIELTDCNTGAQNQIVLVPGKNNPHPASVPEPVSLVVWGIGAGVTAFAASWRRTQDRRRWSSKNRQAIMRIVEGKRS